MSYCTISYENGVINTNKIPFGDEIKGGLGSLYYRKMKEHSGKLAQVEAKSGQYDTFDSLLQKCVRTAIELKNRGVKKGDHISLCSDHHLNAVVPLIASYLIGAVPFPIEPTMETADMEHLVTQIHPKFIFAVKQAKDSIEKCLECVGRRSEVVVFGDGFEREFLKKQENEDLFVPYFADALHETATIYFSSGSTGLPKGICMSHYAIMCSYGLTVKKTEGDHPVTYNPANWYWATSGMVLLTSTVLGGNRILGTLDVDSLWHWVEKYSITKLFLPSIDFIEVSGRKIPPNVDISSLKTLTSTGGPVPTEYVIKMRELLPRTNVFICYGMTEIGYVTLFESYNEKHEKMLREKPNSMGMPVQGMSYKVVDPDTEKTRGPNQPGELLLKTEKLMNGYYGMDCSNRYDEDGWFKTGDIVYYDEDFCFYFVNRIKDELQYRGWWVYPSKLEGILIKHPAVKVAVVVGKPHKTDEEHITAVVVLRDGYENKVTPEELEKYLNDRVHDDRQKLRGGVYIVKDLPLTCTGKINRKQVKEIVIPK